LNYRTTASCYILERDDQIGERRTVLNDELERMSKETVLASFILFQNLPGETEENHKDLSQDGQPADLESGSYGIRSWSANRHTETFGKTLWSVKVKKG
jgi:hypothetical protein